MTKQVKNNLVSDIKRDHVMTDRVIYNQLNWELTKFVENLEWSINNKQSKIEAIDQIFHDFNSGKYEDREGAQTEPDWVDLDNKREWHLKQQEVTRVLRDYVKQSVDQLFPEVKAQAKEDAKAKFAKRLA